MTRASLSPRSVVLCWLSSSLLLFGCSSDATFTSSADVAGNYTITVTNGDNGCALEQWVGGQSTSDIPFLIEQDNANLTGTLQGAAGVLLGLSIGTNKFVGTTSGHAIDLAAYGMIPHQQGNCAFTLNALIKGQTSGDTISGRIEYTPATSTNPDCASLQCASIQLFNGTRPPSAP